MRPHGKPIAILHEGAFELPAYSIDRPQRLVWLMKALGAFHAELQMHDRPATFAELSAVHDPNYLRGLEQLANSGSKAHLDPELIVGPSSYYAATQAAGALLDKARMLLSGRPQHQIPVCLSRPGSHHAGSDYGLGFCLINNLAVAAANVIEEGLAERVAIIDFDAHHGNGTEEIFSRESRVQTISLHQYPFFPGTGAAGPEDAISNFNFALPAHCGTDVVAESWRKAVERVRGFNPQLILVEAGLDGHLEDWTTQLEFDNQTFVYFGHGLRSLRDELNVPILLEAGGGYSEEAVIGGMAALIRGLGS